MSLPKVVIIHEVVEKDGTRYLIASKNVQEAMEDDDGPRVVGTYKQFNRRTLRKNVVATNERRML